VLPKNLVLHTEPQLRSTAVHKRGVNNQVYLARLAEMSYVNFSTLEYIVFSVNSRIFFLQLYENNGDVMLMTEDLLNYRKICC